MRSYNPRNGKGAGEELDPCIAAEVRMKNENDATKRCWILAIVIVVVLLLTLLAVGFVIFVVYSTDAQPKLYTPVSELEVLEPSKRMYGDATVQEGSPLNNVSKEMAPLPSTADFADPTHKPLGELPEVQKAAPAFVHRLPTDSTVSPKFRGTLKYTPVVTMIHPVTTKPTITEASTYSTKSDEVPDNLPSFSSFDDRKYDIMDTEEIYEDCEKYRAAGHVNSGVYKFRIDGLEFRALCLMESDYAWMVLQRRSNGQVSFNRTFNEYAEGFGSSTGDYWLGLEKVHVYSKLGQLQMRIELRGDYCTRSCLGSQYLWGDWNFVVGSRQENYRLSIDKIVRGNLSDALVTNNNQSFSTFDADNDKKPEFACTAFKSFGPWWHRDCSLVALNGNYDETGKHHGIYWYHNEPASVKKFIIKPAKSLIKFRVKA